MAQTKHAVYPEVDWVATRGYAAMKGLSARDAFDALVAMREEAIRKEKENPLVYGWEPPIWRVCDALLGLDWAIPASFGEDYGARMRAVLGFKEPVSLLLLNGGNRAGKSEYMCKRALQCLIKYPATNLWAFHSDSDMSVEYQQPLFWKYMPEPWKGKPVMTKTTYIAYKMKVGFSDASFVLPNLSRCSFRNYAQDKGKIEGGELGTMEAGAQCLGFVADELIPEDWVETLALRLATRGSRGVVGFTPVNGYTGTVKAFLDGARSARDRVAYLMPRDGGALDERCLEVEPCDEWLQGGKGAREQGDDRRFEVVPRVMRCEDKRRAVVFFHSSDNPYGNPREVLNLVASRDSRFKRERYYGIADKLVSGQFPLFKPEVHVVSRDRIPTHGTDYMLCDPCDGRNFFMAWIRCCPGGRMYVVREWPSQVDPVPGQGILGEWALPTGDTKQLDGRRGPAQNSLGWGLLQYKREIARIEQWEEYTEVGPDEDVRAWCQYPEDVPPEARDAARRAGRVRLKIFARFLDARFGNANSLEADGVRTLFEEFDEIGLNFRETGADKKTSLSEGVSMINAALYYNTEMPVVTDVNCPKLFFSEDVKNTIFAMTTWTGRDGGKGATKDPVDLIRYAFLKHLEYVEESPELFASMAGRGCY
jgi:hypothetical protein